MTIDVETDRAQRQRPHRNQRRSVDSNLLLVVLVLAFLGFSAAVIWYTNKTATQPGTGEAGAPAPAATETEATKPE